MSYWVNFFLVLRIWVGQPTAPQRWVKCREHILCNDKESHSSSPPSSNLSYNYFEITHEIRLQSLSWCCQILFSQCVFVVSGADSVVSYVLCSSHETGWSGCACSLAPIRPLLCTTYSTGLNHQYAPHAGAGRLHWQQAALLSECRLSDLITLWGRRGHCH